MKIFYVISIETSLRIYLLWSLLTSLRCEVLQPSLRTSLRSKFLRSSLLVSLRSGILQSSLLASLRSGTLQLSLLTSLPVCLWNIFLQCLYKDIHTVTFIPSKPEIFIQGIHSKPEILIQNT